MNKAKGYALIVILLTAISVEAAPVAAKKAPSWDIETWFNGSAVTLEELKGKVIVVEFFQLWCPGCNSFSIPLMKRWSSIYTKPIQEGKLQLISIHTVFEGHSYQNNQRLKAFLKEKKISHLVGVDMHRDSSGSPETMQKYRTGGTPAMAVIDKDGYIRFQKFGRFDTDKVESYVWTLLKE